MLVRPPLIELRQYVLAPGKRERMIELFDSHFSAAQDRAGMPMLGTFRVPGVLDRLVWIRGFPDWDSRPERLGTFYGGPIWAQFGQETIGYVKEFNNVQLLREAEPGAAIAVELSAPIARDSKARAGAILATTYRLTAAPDEAFVRLFEERVRPRIDGTLLGHYVSDPTPNNFPALPIREGEHLFTWFARIDAAVARYSKKMWLRIPSSLGCALTRVTSQIDGNCARKRGRERKGQPVVLLAGLGHSAHVFDDFARKLASGYRVFGVTRRGYGGSSVPKTATPVTGLADDVIAVINGLRLERLVIIGHSIAGLELSSMDRGM